MKSYQESAKDFEAKWQRYWDEHEVYKTPNPNEPEADTTKPKYVILDMFPYPSGTGLHVGHPLGYIATDVKQRFMRMQGYNVLYSMGFDAFGLPAEQFAIQTGQHPRITTENNINNMLKQLRLLGLGHDPNRRFNTTDPDYYRWTQWIFLQIYNSYYDPTEAWTGPDGFSHVGRARPIADLVKRLKAGEWVLDENGVPTPKSQAPQGRSPKASEMKEALDKARLAYVAEIPVNWCPQLGTVLSNEEVTNEGRSERGDHPVYRRPLKQWNLRITAYADRLLSDLDDLNWPYGVSEMQRDWIGRSEGATVHFPVKTLDGADEKITIYTTRPDTLFGATYMVLAPEHPLVPQLTQDPHKGTVERYCAEAARVKSVKTEGTQEKTGVFTGSYALNPVSGESIPVWVADYVLMEYGTGAIMGVPGSDDRDFEFATVFKLPIIPVVQPTEDWLREHAPEDKAELPFEELLEVYRTDAVSFKAAFTDKNTVIMNSANDGISLNGVPTLEAIHNICEWIESSKIGYTRIQYKLRDWLFSRQRYWGEPFPVVFDPATDEAYPMNDSELPVLLPELNDFTPKGSDDPNSEPEPPLARVKDWMTVQGVILEDGSVRLVTEKSADDSAEFNGQTYTVRNFRRDPNSMPNWAGSCWYYLRYFDAKNNEHLTHPDVEQYWSTGLLEDGKKKSGSVDLYVGGTEHAVLHLLYARFWHKVLYDLNHVTTKEPFHRLFNQGMITADAYKDQRGVYVDIHDVEVRNEAGNQAAFNKKTGEQLVIDPGKMGKRYKNGIPPEEVCAEYTIDTFRAFEMYLGPLDAGKPWNSGSIIGILRFLSGIWRLQEIMVDDGEAPIDAELERTLHKTIKKATEDIDRLRMNTALAALIELKNSLAKQAKIPKSYLRTLTLLVSPFAPHLAEELMSALYPEEHAEHKTVLAFSWPTFDPEKCKDAEIEVPLMVNGKKRDTLMVPSDISQEALEAMARSNPRVLVHTEGKTIQRVVVVMNPNRKLVNIVAK